MAESKWIILTGWTALRDLLEPWIAFILAALALLAFWPKLKNSAIGKLTRENIRLRGLLADMTVEESVKNVVILSNKKQIEELQAAIVELHREQFEQTQQRTKEPPKSTGGRR